MTNCEDTIIDELNRLFEAYQLKIEKVQTQQNIPGSFWGDSEAGLIGQVLYVREDTPLHSALHEACHYICMDKDRRDKLHTDAAGDYDEENGVCYLQILLSEHLASSSKAALMREMDEWGYSFRLGSTQKWFEEDAEDAQNWLIEHQIINKQKQVLWQLSK